MHGEGRSSRGGSGQWESRGVPGTAAPLSGGRRGVRRLVLMAAVAGDGGAGGVVDGGVTEAAHLSSPPPEEAEWWPHVVHLRVCLVCRRVAAGAVADLNLLEMVGRSEPGVGRRLW